MKRALPSFVTLAPVPIAVVDTGGRLRPDVQGRVQPRRRGLLRGLRQAHRKVVIIFFKTQLFSKLNYFQNSLLSFSKLIIIFSKLNYFQNSIIFKTHYYLFQNSIAAVCLGRASFHSFGVEIKVLRCYVGKVL
jgi:hypothetical protein